MLTTSCPQCGNRNPASGIYCTNCGLQIANPQPQEKQTPSFVVIAVVVISVLFGGLGLFSLAITSVKTGDVKAKTLLSNQSNSVSPAVSPTPITASFANNEENVIEGKVVGIQDGDTITVLDAAKTQHKIRLQGIDAPELEQPYGQVSKMNLSELVFNQNVFVSWNKLDKYGRKVGMVYLGSKDINLEQIKAGYAWHYKEYQNEQTKAARDLFAGAEKKARTDNSGLWNDGDPVAPWDYRHFPKQKNETLASTSEQGEIIGNSSSYIYHWPGCPNYSDISFSNRVYFKTTEAAENAGYRAARNCRSLKPVSVQTEKPTSLADADSEDDSSDSSQASLEEAPTPKTVYRAPQISSYPQSKPSYSTPAPTTSAPAGASARCNDGTISYSRSRRGTCSHHGGVAVWY